jgi:hypothetical protein
MVSVAQLLELARKPNGWLEHLRNPSHCSEGQSRSPNLPLFKAASPAQSSE